MRQRGRDIPDENEDDILYNVDYFEKTSRQQEDDGKQGSQI